MNTKKIIEEYSENYCHGLELAYGDGMMSEGRAEAIDHMFNHTVINNKMMLDIGFGLGGLAIYLARKYHAHVKGIEINPWMVSEASRRISQELKEFVSFHHYEDVIPFEDSLFDIVYSKGVLCHIEDKNLIFKEIYRILKPTGRVVINDWLSPVKNKWSGRMQEMCELDDLTIFADTEDNYRSILLVTGFTNIKIRDENDIYAQYNRDIADRLEEKENAKKFIAQFGEQELLNSVKGYRLIAEAIEAGEILVRNIIADK